MRGGHPSPCSDKKLIPILVLLVLFRGQWRYLLLPLPIVLLTLTWTLGIFQMLGGEFNWLTAILPLILTVASLSDSLHVLEFFKEEIPDIKDGALRIAKTIHTVWKPCLYTTLTNIVGLLSLIFWKESPRQIKMFGLFGALGLGLALFLTFILFAIIAPYLPLNTTKEAPVRENKTDFWESFFEKVFLFSRNHGAKILLTFLLLTPVFIYGINLLDATVDVKHYFRKTIAIGSSLDYIDEHFRGLATFGIVFEGGTSMAHAILPPVPGDAHSRALPLLLSDDSLQALRQANACYRRFEYPSSSQNLNCDWESFHLKTRQGRMAGSSLSVLDFLPSQAGANNPQEVLDRLADIGGQSAQINHLIRFFFSKDGQKTQLVRLAHAESSEPVKVVNDRISADLVSFCSREGLPTCQATLSGIGQVWNQFAQKLTGFLKKSFGMAGMSVFLLMMFFFLPHIDLGVLSLIPNIMPNIFILGFMGLFGIPLDMSTAMVGSVALGLIVDDSIHFLHVFQKKVSLTGNFEEAVLHSLKSCGRPVMMTTLILIGGFSILTVGDFMPVVQVGRLLMLIITCGAVFELLLTPSLLLVVYKPFWRRFYGKKSIVNAWK